MNVLKSKKGLAAIAGVLMAVGTLITCLSDAKADPGLFAPEWTYYGNTCTLPSTTNHILGKYEVGEVTGDGLWWERLCFYNGGTTANKEVFIIKTFRHLGPTVHMYCYVDETDSIRFSPTVRAFWSGQLAGNAIYHFDRKAAFVDSSLDTTLAQVHFVMDSTIDGQVNADKCVWTSTIQDYDN